MDKGGGNTGDERGGGRDTKVRVLSVSICFPPPTLPIPFFAKDENQ